MPSTKLEHVIIAGGGLGGLSAALSFHYLFSRHNLKAPRVTIYERERSESSRVNEGYTIGIRGNHIGGGVQALKTINEYLYTDLRSMAAPAGEGNVAVKFGFGVNCDSNPALKLKKSAEEKDSFRIARFKLRNRLVEEVKRIGEPKIKLEWNSYVVTADYDEGQHNVNVKLIDGRRDECDLLIGEVYSEIGSRDGNGSIRYEIELVRCRIRESHKEK